jgi:hypothetical protein
MLCRRSSSLRCSITIWGRYGFIGGQRPVRGTTLARRDDSIRTSLRHCWSPFPGNGILRGRDSGVEKARHIQPIVSRDKTPARKPTDSALFARTPGNLCFRGTAWWGWEDSNLQPSGYRQEMGEAQSSHSANLCSRRSRNYNAISMTYVFAVLF